MSASVTQPVGHGQEQDLVGAPLRSGTGRGAKKAVLVGFLLAMALSGCDGGGSVSIESPNPSSSAPSSASPTATSEDEQQALLSQYRLFWSSLASISKQPSTSRRVALSTYAINPELDSILKGFAALDAKGQVLYGQNRPRPTVKLSPNGQTAVVDDCQDSSRAGTADRHTMRRLNTGRARNHVVVTMKKANDLWKLAFVAYTTTPC